MEKDEFRGMTDEQIAACEASVLKTGMPRSEDDIRRLSDQVRETAYAVHRYLGTGYLEKVYENALKHRLEKSGLKVRQQMPIRVYDEDGYQIGFYEADLVVEGKMILELKAISRLCQENEAQLINYLKATGIRDGMLVNFGSEKFEGTTPKLVETRF